MRTKYFDDKDIDEALFQAGNNYKKAEQLLNNGLVYGV